MFGLFFTNQSSVTCFADVMACDGDRFNTFYHGMLAEGIYMAPSAFETGFVSSAHSQHELDITLAAAEKVFSTL
jgi:glutamate-1-semialdehyde 2,1-aminomutase